MYAPADNVPSSQPVLMRFLVRSWDYRRPRLWVGVRVACGIFNVALGVLLLASVHWLGSLTWLAALPLAGAALIFWTVYRLPQDSVAYFCAAELLSNVAKHSRARHATLEAVRVAGLLRVRVSDDRAGGARLEARGGLAGLADRVRTVDGRLQVSSPPGGPTVVTAELPSHT